MTQRRILKWVLPVDDKFHEIKGDFLHAGIASGPREHHDKEHVLVWTMCGTDLKSLPAVEYLVVGTGHPIDNPDLFWCGTVQADPFVWHVLFRVPGPADFPQSEHSV